MSKRDLQTEESPLSKRTQHSSVPCAREPPSPSSCAGSSQQTLTSEGASQVVRAAASSTEARHPFPSTHSVPLRHHQVPWTAMQQQNGTPDGAIDTDLYSRQLGTLGFEAMGKLIKLKVLVSGLRGVGVEAAKNIILAGPKTVMVHDDSPCEARDQAANFLITDDHVAQSEGRGTACMNQLAALNQYVNVGVIKGELTENVLKNFDVVVISEKTRSELIRINDLCRTHGIKFITCDVFGLAASVFVDFGDEFFCVDKDGEEPKSTIVAGITHEKVATVQTHNDKLLPFQDGDYVVFREVQGMSEINKLPPMQIKVTGKETFTIGDTTCFSRYTREGIATQVKMPVKMQFKSYQERCTKPLPDGECMLVTPDLAKFGRPEQLHFISQAILTYKETHQAPPPIRSDAAVAEVTASVRALLDKARLEEGSPGVVVLDEIPEDILKKVVYFSDCHLSPMAAFIGGVVAQEVVKATGKYTPLRQWLYFDALECLGKDWEGSSNKSEYHPEGGRYDDQTVIWGKTAQQKLGDIKLFLVGAGALGCEFLKSIALMGICCGPNGLLTVTDMDNIEVSNLNRQFLFRREHVGASKSVTSAAMAKLMNKNLAVKPLELRVGLDTEDTLDDDFWNSLHIVVNALDNVQARQYVDSRCVWFNKPLMESGTLGTKANVQVVLPHLTQSYSETQDPPEESIPLCTLKHFPHAIEHTIEWARDLFAGLFCDGPQDAQRFVKDPQTYIKKLAGEGTPAVQRQRLEKIRDLLCPSSGDASLEGCVARAVLLFHDNFYVQIAQLLHNFPLDHLTSDGRPFWSGPKRPPTAIYFDAQDATHLEFIAAAANLLAVVAGVPRCNDRETITRLAQRITLPTFAPREVRIKVDDRDTTVEGAGDDEVVRDELQNILLAKIKSGHTGNIEPIEFEKDDDTNHHVAFIWACANLRARNYKIPECDYHKCKMIAGKIIPAMATTTAMVTGLVSLEILKYLISNESRQLEDFKNAFINLALPLWLFSEPLPPTKTINKAYDPVALGPVKARPHGFTTWDKFSVNIANGTVHQLTEALRKEFNVDVSIMSIGNACLYNSFLPAHKKSRLHAPISETYEAITKQKLRSNVRYLIVEASCQDVEDQTDVIIPRIRFQFK